VSFLASVRHTESSSNCALRASVAHTEAANTATPTCSGHTGVTRTEANNVGIRQPCGQPARPRPVRAAPTGLGAGATCGLNARLCSLPLAPGRVRWGGLRPELGSAERSAPHTPLRFVRAPRTPPLAAIVWKKNPIRNGSKRTPPPFAVQTFALRTPFIATHWLSRVDPSPFAPPGERHRIRSFLDARRSAQPERLLALYGPGRPAWGPVRLAV